MNEGRARELVAAERARIETALADLTGDIRASGPLERQQTGEQEEVGTDLQMEGVDMALVANLREQLAAVRRAEERIAAGTYGRSVESGTLIPAARLEAAPLAERTVDEQSRFEREAPPS
ncbi:MAG TPA: hypothetical protein VID26_13465 [Candidatus Limnocylindrales bacterium]|jgi:DnaK suppressor protein